MLSRIFLLALPLLAPVFALPAVRNVEAGAYPIVPGDNGSCQKMGQLCAAQIGDNYDSLVASGSEFQVSPECTLSAVCQQMYYNGTVDDWIVTYFGARSDGTAAGSYSLKAQRLPENIYDDLLVTHTRIVTEPVFLQAYNGTLAKVGGPYPDVEYMDNVWTRVVAWTGSCSSMAVAYSQMADWLQLSSTEPGPVTC